MRTTFEWKYPLWYARNNDVDNSVLLDTARSGIRYTHHISIRNSVIAAPKTFRRADGIHLENVSMPNAEESLWRCSSITMNNIDARGDYFAKDARDITVRGLKLTGNYAFDGGRNIEVSDSMLISKDAFWNCENVVVRD